MIWGLQPGESIKRKAAHAADLCSSNMSGSFGPVEPSRGDDQAASGSSA